jgi:hypothetical protein
MFINIPMPLLINAIPEFHLVGAGTQIGFDLSGTRITPHRCTNGDPWTGKTLLIASSWRMMPDGPCRRGTLSSNMYRNEGY